MTRLFLLLFLFLLPAWSQESKPIFRDRGEVILRELLAQAWADSWQGATLEAIQLIRQKEDLAQPTGLPPVWHAEIKGPAGKSGYLIWDCSNEGKLVEFALDDDLPIPGAITGLPTQQQFAVPGPNDQPMASGCVPTSAASVVLHWMDRLDRKAPGKKEMTLVLRKRLTMSRFPDTDGFTENGMALAGAFPHKMAEALNAEATKRDLPIRARLLRFSMAPFRKEIVTGRPTLLSCTVRVPHKPQLSWGHAVAGIAAVELDGVELVGIHDNFFPTEHPETIRFIRQDAFRTLTIIGRPMSEKK